MSRLNKGGSECPEVIQQIACVANHAQPLFSSNPSLTVVGEQAKFRREGGIQWIVTMRHARFCLESFRLQMIC